jgi:hypothetical protein
MLDKTVRRGGKKILLGWNRGLGDIALGLYAIIEKIREKIPHAEITFLTRENLKDGFSMLKNIAILVALDWARGKPYSVEKSLRQLNIDPKNFDLIIEAPSPTDWVAWQRGKVIPRLQWDPSYDSLWKSFDLPEDFIYIAVQPQAETNYGLWRNWPIERWNALFARLEKMAGVKAILLGFDKKPLFPYENIIDFRGKTTLFQLLSIVKNRCKAALLPDSGILSMLYYLEADFPLQLLSLWADPRHGILKQAVASPNCLLSHHPLIGAHRDLSSVSVDTVMHRLFPAKPLLQCPMVSDALPKMSYRAGAIILAGGQGSRLGCSGPKGVFEIKGKSLFQWICEKAPQENFPLAIMTSKINHDETVRFFEKNHFFGREIYFFQQTMHPLFDENKKELKLEAPDGNGAVFQAFKASGIAALFEEKKIHAVSILPVDNPLADPNDSLFISHHLSQKNDVTIKCVERLSPQEKMGALVERGGKIEITEYLDLDPDVNYIYGNTGILVMDLAFLLKMADIALPFHWVKKKLDGKIILKAEKFIFDALPFASKAGALCYPRQKCYAPIKDLLSIKSLQL